MSVKELLPTLTKEDLLVTRGIEKEGLRVNAYGHIAQDDHPYGAGSALTHPHITTDYSEALLEFITPVRTSAQAVLDDLHALHHFTLTQMPSQTIWPASMPCKVDGELDIRIAEYGDSHLGQLKHVYRHGLWHRYGRLMQAIAGMHYNFSVPESLLAKIAQAQGSELTQDKQTELYFNLIRNFRRYQWLLLHLFGASPAFDQSFKVGRSASLPKFAKRSHLLDTATTLRMSDIGYSNNVQSDLFVCFNSLNSYAATLSNAMQTSFVGYENIGLQDGKQWKQLNTNVLQIENEYYSDIRPKRNAKNGEKPLQALTKYGVEYIEVRCLDLNPFEPLGSNLAQLQFLDTFLLWCLMSDSPKLSDEECHAVRVNQQRAINHGLNKDALLKDGDTERTIGEWGLALIDDMQAIADQLEGQYSGTRAALDTMREKLKGNSETVAQRMVREMKAEQADFQDWAERLAVAHKQTILAQAPNPEWQATLTEQTKASHLAEQQLSKESQGSFNDYLAAWLAK
ncbi:glutamate--cysteine ligase [Salinibius halmophilus]|uniref:glutamate--cysteine ligase n=1 Tax=Salinibius halmophilus TaxID=1853216 RepID=UPI000E670595|nr:glutamate--cysteine ligase [Salinibius halmophilus]